MSRQRVNSGWVYGDHSATATSTTEGNTVAFDTLLDGSNLRIDAGAPLVGERADYFVERLLIWGTCFYTPTNPTVRSESVCNIRVGTIDADVIPLMIENQLWSDTNAEFWGRILQDVVVAAYANPTEVYDGDGLAVDTGATATRRSAKFAQLGTSDFHLDIQQRFSLQRQEDRLILAICQDPNHFQEGDLSSVLFTYKMLVKEYRR